MKIGIIGSGNVGKALAGGAVKAGHTVTITSRHSEKAAAAAKETGASQADSNLAAVKDAELVVLAVPGTAIDEVAAGLGNALDGKVIVDVTNRFNPQNPAAAVDGSSMSEHIQTLAPHSHVTKAFNYAFASKMADPRADGTALDGFVAGDDERAKKQVLELVRSIGFRPIDVGPLAMARVLEGLGILNITLQIRNKWPWQSGWKLVGPSGD